MSCTECLNPSATLPVKLECGHTFCLPCIKPFLQQNQCCPVDSLPATVPALQQAALASVLKLPVEDQLRIAVSCPDEMKQAWELGATTTTSNVLDVRYIKNLLTTKSSTFLEHFYAQTVHHTLYWKLIRILVEGKVDIKAGCKARVLAVALARKDLAHFEMCLSEPYKGLLGPDRGEADVFGFAELLKAVKLLDSKRQLRQLDRKLARVEAQMDAVEADPELNANAKPARLKRLRGKENKLNKTIRNLSTEPIPYGSISGGVSTYLRKVLGKISVEKLNFFALLMPKEPWQEMADLIHMRPDDLQAPWFTPGAFGNAPPNDSIAASCAMLSRENAKELIMTYKPPLSFIRTKVNSLEDLDDEVKLMIASYCPIDHCIWWHQQLDCDGYDDVLVQRLEAGTGNISLGYGKVMERLLYLSFDKPDSRLLAVLLEMAQNQLATLDLDLESPVVVFGDASASMDVAIRVATIFCSVVRVLCKAEIRFFNDVSFVPDLIPETARDVLEVAHRNRANNCTAPAASLWEFYSQKKHVNYFVIVTDEVENRQWEGMSFAIMFEKYLKEVNPNAKLIFISFLGANQQGQMVQELKAKGIEPVQFVLDERLPDLTKMESIFSQMAMQSAAFAEQLL